jgi:signal transduction histidine kinase
MQGRVPVFVRDRRYWLILLAFWSAVVAWSLHSHLQDIRSHSQAVVTEGARNMFRMVQLTRLWNSQHGGVYVPVDEKTQPNPYLKHATRDISDNQGRQLTLINPAYMTRLIGELAKLDGGMVFHLTSLNPINPANTPDPWERDALLSFDQGVQERSGFEEDAGNGLVHRYMAPLVVAKACLQCHAAQGYKLGDVRGGISVTQRYGPFLEAARPSEMQGKLMHGVVYLLMLAICWWLLEQLRRRWLELSRKIDEVELARNELLQSEKMASLGRMVAGFAHEINTPIGIAVGAISNSEGTLNEIDRLLESEDVSEDALRAALATLRQGDQLAVSNLRRAAALVQSFKRTSIDQASDEERVFLLSELIDDVFSALHNQLKRTQVSATVDCPKNLKIKGAPGLLEQVLTNLVMNSIAHGFDNGQMAGSIKVAACLMNDRLTIDYSDTGVGMSEAVASKIFEPFFTTRRGQGGSGLGMYICYSIVTVRLGGTIRCESAPGAGTRFLIEYAVSAKSSGENPAGAVQGID